MHKYTQTVRDSKMSGKPTFYQILLRVAYTTLYRNRNNNSVGRTTPNICKAIMKLRKELKQVFCLLKN